MRKLIIKFVAFSATLEGLRHVDMAGLAIGFGVILAIIVFADVLLDYAPPQ